MSYQEFSTIFLNTVKIFKSYFFSFDKLLARKHYKRLMAFILMSIFNVKSINQINNQMIKDGLYNFFKSNCDILDALFMNWTQFVVSSVLQLTPYAVRSKWPSALYVSRVKVYHRTIGHSLLIYDQRSNEDKIYLTTAYELSTASIIIFYSERWDIESFFRDAKQHLNLADFGFQRFNANQIYLCFRLLSYYFLVLFRQSKPFLSGMTIGELKKLINQKFYKIAQHYGNQFDKVIFHYLR